MVEIQFEVDTALSPSKSEPQPPTSPSGGPRSGPGSTPSASPSTPSATAPPRSPRAAASSGASGLESTTTGPTPTGWSPGYWTPTSSVPAAAGSCGSDLGPMAGAGWSGPRCASPAASKDASWCWPSGSPAASSSVAICTRPCPSSSTRPREHALGQAPVEADERGRAARWMPQGWGEGGPAAPLTGPRARWIPSSGERESKR
jgi:hypothetical protein